MNPFCPTHKIRKWRCFLYLEITIRYVIVTFAQDNLPFDVVTLIQGCCEKIEPIYKWMVILRITMGEATAKDELGERREKKTKM